MKPTAGALRASKAIQQDPALLKSLPELIDRETGVREILDILQSIMRRPAISSKAEAQNSSQRPVLR